VQIISGSKPFRDTTHKCHELAVTAMKFWSVRYLEKKLFISNEAIINKLLIITKNLINMLNFFCSRIGLTHIAVNISNVSKDQILKFYSCQVSVIGLILN